MSNMSNDFTMPSWNYNHKFGSNTVEETKMFDQSTMLALGYLRNKRARVWRTKKSWIASFEGGHREGKSFAAQLFGAILDDTFLKDLDGRIVHGHKMFKDKVKEFDAKKIYGGVIVADEAGVVGNFSSAEWQKEWMAAINSIMQMFGYLHPIILFIAPDRAFIDPKTRRMFHTLHRVSRPNNEYSVIKSYNLKWNQMKHKWDEINPVIRIGNTKIKMKHLIIRNYPQDLAKRYQELEQIRKPIMLEDLDQRITASQITEAKKTYDNDALADVVYNELFKYISKRSKPGHTIVDPVLVKVGLGVPMDNAKYIKTLVERKCQNNSGSITPQGNV